MSVSLPMVNMRWPLCRVLTSRSFNLGAGEGGWTVQPMWSKRRRGYGMELLSFSRVALPAVGEAALRFRVGRVDGDLVGVLDADTQSSLQAGNGWDAAGDNISAPDLRGHEIRIQLAPWAADGETPEWATYWWGQCEFQEDRFIPGATHPMGERIYRCVDGFARTRRWPMNRHSAYSGGTGWTHSHGHPGYNVGGQNNTRGNRSSVNDVTTSTEVPPDTDGRYYRHAWPGLTGALTWTDAQAVEHALRIGRGEGDPLFIMTGNGAGDSTDPLRYFSLGATPWTVNEQDAAFDFVSRVCRRQRGRGLVFVDWDDDSGNPTGTLAVKLTTMPQVAENLAYATAWTTSGVTTAALPGATLAGTATTVDLIGDHRLVSDSFLIGDRDTARYDAVESVGERLEVLVSLSVLDESLEARWSTAAQTAFALLAANKRLDESWKSVYQLYGLPRRWGFAVKDANNTNQHRCDYRCDDTGTVAPPPPVGQGLDTSPLVVEILPDLPLLEGYDYTTAVSPREGGSETGTPARRPPFPFIRKASNRYLSGDEIARPLGVQESTDGLFIYAPSDTSPTGATRIVGNTATANLSSTYNTSALCVTVGLRLPQRVRMLDYATGFTSTTSRRRLTVYHEGVHLWLADHGAVWDLDTSGRNSDGSTGRRGAVSGVQGRPGILRDDRAALGLLHSLAVSWYLTNRKTATWALRGCGFLPSFDTASEGETNASGDEDFPHLGQLVTTLAAGGQVHDIGTPITSMSYDHQAGVTTWATDWAELDFK